MQVLSYLYSTVNVKKQTYICPDKHELLNISVYVCIYSYVCLCTWDINAKQGLYGTLPHGYRTGFKRCSDAQQFIQLTVVDDIHAKAVEA